MKKTINNRLFKSILFLSILLCLNAILAFNIKISPLKTRINNNLLYENYELKKKYDELKNKVDSIETNIKTINNYNDYIKTQILGENNDSAGYYKFINFKTDKNINDQINSLSESTNYFMNKAINTILFVDDNKEKMNSYPNLFPIEVKDSIKINRGFGWKKHPIFKIVLFHDGIDIPANTNTNVFSTMCGKVEKVKYSRFGYGNEIVIKNDAGYQTLYAHLNTICISEGETIKKGQLIAKSGNTGLSTSAHLHYEIRYMNKLRDPEQFVFMNKRNNYLAKK
jgi:murein DD-endopeptidase MepM/ murein hydrolase activator NlpD